uniref:Uncharacterized protein n=1 Tax=Rhizophora mucronata TaxID=61149 RepID=A0A2P2P3V1_RHIMU
MFNPVWLPGNGGKSFERKI